jgi:orotidine-5'-phosphate decarboxylase
MTTGLIAALDTTDAALAKNWARAVAPSCGLLKLGLEFFLSNGAEGLRSITERPVFLDLKLHDIPNTVIGGMRAILPLKPAMLTLHASGGSTMIGAARKEAEKLGASRPILLAVTVLTSMDANALNEIGVSGGPRQQVLRLARMAIDSGADGIVCSAQEVAMLRDALGDAPVLVVPGIRPAGADIGDQARVMTPAEAARAGASWIVVGRPITQAADPTAAAAAILAELESAA